MGHVGLLVVFEPVSASDHGKVNDALDWLDQSLHLTSAHTLPEVGELPTKYETW